MKRKPGFEIVDVAGENIAVPVGEHVTQFQGILAFSDAAAFLYQALEKPRTREELLQLLTQEYDVTPETAGKDLDRYLEELRQMELIED